MADVTWDPFAADPAPSPADAVPGDGPRPGTPGTHRPRGRRVLIVLAVVLGTLLVDGAWLAVRGAQAAGALQGAVPVVGALQRDLDDGDLEAAAARLPVLTDAARTATSATTDPVWRLAEHVPWLGRQLTAVSDVSRAFGLLAVDAVPALTEVGEALSPENLRPVDGRLDLAPLLAAGPQLSAAADAAVTAQGIVDAIDDDGLVDPLAERVVDAQTAVGEAASTLRAASTVAELVPAMLGATGERTYLLLVLNSAELRSGGGLVGAVAQITADDGALELVDHRAARDLPTYEEPVLPLSPEEERVHTALMGRYVQNVTMTPDFPRSAQLVAEMWQRSTGRTVDGVVALDAVALSYVLAATGPVAEPGGEALDDGNVVRALLHESYLEHPDPEATDEFFAGAAAAVFDALASGQGDQRAFVPSLRRAVEERRLSLWSAEPGEQEHLARAVLGGSFLGGPADSAAGLFLDDGTGAKLNYFLEVGVAAGAVSCTGDGTVLVRVDLGSSLPDGYEEWTKELIGAGITVPPGTMRTNLTLYSPVGGEVVAVRRGSTALGGQAATEGGRDVVVLTSTLAPGESESYELEVRPRPGGTIGEVWSTATVDLPGRHPVAACR